MGKDISIREKRGDNSRPEAYPKPSDADQQYNNQDEFVDQQPNQMGDKSVSNMAAPPNTHQNNDPSKELNDR